MSSSIDDKCFHGLAVRPNMAFRVDVEGEERHMTWADLSRSGAHDGGRGHVTPSTVNKNNSIAGRATKRTHKHQEPDTRRRLNHTYLSRVASHCKVSRLLFDHEHSDGVGKLCPKRGSGPDAPPKTTVVSGDGRRHMEQGVRH